MYTERDGRDDFEFVFGSWKVHHRRLRERLKGSTEWEEFEGTSVAHPILGGIGTFDENVMYRESGVLEGVSLRLYDPKSHEWRIWWASSLGGTLELPMIGGFDRKNGRGEFYAHEPNNGVYVYSRFIWSEITEKSCRWEQALSPDGGKTWETNWIMHLTRTG